MNAFESKQSSVRIAVRTQSWTLPRGSNAGWEALRSRRRVELVRDLGGDGGRVGVGENARVLSRSRQAKAERIVQPGSNF